MYALRGSILGGLGVAFVAGPLGCFIVWRRMAYFGDTMAHSALAGVALGIVWSIDLILGVILVTVTLALVLLPVQRQRTIALDTMLGIMSHSALAAGLVAVSLMRGTSFDITGFLFGDVLSVLPMDIYLIYGGGAAVLAVLGFIWRPLVALTVHEDLARAEGVSAMLVQAVFMILVAVCIALAMKVVGILLVTSMLIIPAATARRLSTGPEMMALVAAAIGAVAVFGGLQMSMTLDTPGGPSIIVVAAVFFIAVSAASVMIGHIRRKGRT